MKTTTVTKTSRTPLRPFRCSSLPILALVICLQLLPRVQAVSPPPDGGYGGANTAEGGDALFSLTTGVWNAAVGFRALYNNATGIRNTAIGYEALYNTNGPLNVSGQDNVAIGAKALFSNTTGNRNIAIGSLALNDNTTGSDNIAIGNRALWQSTGSGNTQIGDSFYSDPDSVQIGRRPSCSTDISPTAYIHAYDIFIGDPLHFVGSGLENCIQTGPTHSVHIIVDDVGGSVFVAGVNNHPIAGSQVVIDTNGQLGVAPSSNRFKNDIKAMGQSSEAILALKPVTFRYKEEIDHSRTPQFGLVAEAVEKVNPDLVTRDKEGKAYSVRYDAVNAMLLNEFLKEHRKVEKLESAVAELSARLKEQDSKIERISHEFELSKAAPQVVANR